MAAYLVVDFLDFFKMDYFNFFFYYLKKIW